MSAPDALRLAGFDAAAFLRESWQKRPLLIRNPWAAWANPLEPDELAGLACEDGVESRLVVQGDHPEDPTRWSVEHGPIPEERFGELGTANWTLLVQAVDHFVPAVAALIEPFRFVPDWRIDDVMVSFAAQGGGVGPHSDQYDVFLIQGLGRRRWRVGGPCGAAAELLPHADLRLLAGFEPVEEWICEPGDILYLPPGFAHDGVALDGECMTYSVGFRAPSRAELIGHWADELLDRLPEEDRYGDPGLRLQANPGEIAPDALAALQAMVLDALADPAAFARWFGRHASMPKYPETDWRPEEPVDAGEVCALLAAGTPLLRNPASRFAFIRRRERDVLLFVDGECFDCAGETAAFAEELCAHTSVAPDAIPAEAAELVAILVNHGCVAFEPD